MTERQSHNLANRTRRELKLAAQRRDILFSDGQKALDMILDAPSPAVLVQSFPDQDLYYLMHKVGVHDFIPVLAMADSKQWEYILDTEVWDGDRLDTAMMTQVFSLLFKADPKRLLRWTITEKPDFLEYYIFRNMEVVIREHDELPPSDFEDYITFDDKFYFRFPDRSDADQDEDGTLPAEAPGDHTALDQAPELIENMLKTLADMDLTVFHGLLLETSALLPAETEEEQFRLKNIRLAEKGFLPPHEALGIYQPPRDGGLKKRAALKDTGPDPDIPLPPAFFTQFMPEDNLFVRALSLAETPGNQAEFHNELAALINKIISADRVKLRNRESVEKVMKKATAYLSLGLEALLEGEASPVAAARAIRTFFLEDIFRTGSRAGIRLQTRARAWHEKSFLSRNGLPLSFLTETYLGVIGGLMIQRPMFFANYADGELYRHFSSMGDVRATERLLDDIVSLDEFLATLPVDIATFSRGVLTYKSMMLTLWARNRIGLDRPGEASLAPIPLPRFREFFTDLFAGGSAIEEEKARDIALWAAEASGRDESDLAPPLQGVLYALIREVEDEYGSVRPDRIDPRFMPLFLLEGGE